MSGAGNKRDQPADLDFLLSERLTQGRLALKLLAAGGQPFPKVMLDAFVDNFLPGPAVAQERLKIEDAIYYGDFYGAPSLVTPEKQLLHAAYLTYLMKNPDRLRDPLGRKNLPLQQTRYWQDLTNCPDATAALGGFAAALDNNTTIDWGKPGSWFYFDREHDHVNIDFYYGLLLGFRHSHAVFLHERGHAELTENWPKSLSTIIDKIKIFEEKTKKGEELTKEEYIAYSLLDAEATLRHMIFNSGEDNCVNRYAANLTPRMNYHVGFSLNNANVILQGTGETVLDLVKMNQRMDSQQDPEQKKAWERFQNLQRTVMQSFYSTNNLFVPSPESWQRLEVTPDWIRETEWKPEHRAQWGDDPFAALVDFCIGPKGLANIQPRYSDRFFPGFDRKVSEASGKRNEILERIWDIYAQPLLPPLLKLAEEQAQERLQQAEQEAKEQEDSIGQPQQGAGGSGKPDEQQRKVKVKGVGEAEGFKERSKKPGSGHPKPDKDRSRRAGDVLREVEQHQANEKARQQAKKLGKKLSQGEKAGEGGDIRLEDLARRDWKEYDKRVAELRPQIIRAADRYVKVIRKQTEIFNQLARQRDLLPERFEREQYDLDARRAREHKEEQGEEPRPRDMADWRQSSPTSKPTNIDALILIDGSGSMKSGAHDVGSDGVTRMEVALQLAIIHYEGTKLANEMLRGQSRINVWIGIWGPEQIQLIATPNADPRVIGSNLETVRETINSGTDLSPALIQGSELLSEQMASLGSMSGSSHWIIISDGELSNNDVEPTRACLRELARSRTRSTVDIALIHAKDSTMANLVDECKQQLGYRNGIDKHEITNPNDAAFAVLRLMEQRLGSAGISAEPDSAKRFAFRRLALRMREATGSQIPYGPHNGVVKNTGLFYPGTLPVTPNPFSHNPSPA